jgi:hypothetical protein
LDDGKIETVDSATITPEAFYTRYVARRRPVVLTGIPPDIVGAAGWDTASLAAAAGTATVRVEERTVTTVAAASTSASASEGSEGNPGFGQGQHTMMPFAELLARLDAGDETLYLTTQPEAPLDCDDRSIGDTSRAAIEIAGPPPPAIAATPVAQLLRRGDIAARPVIPRCRHTFTATNALGGCCLM